MNVFFFSLRPIYVINIRLTRRPKSGAPCAVAFQKLVGPGKMICQERNSFAFSRLHASFIKGRFALAPDGKIRIRMESRGLIRRIYVSHNCLSRQRRAKENRVKGERRPENAICYTSCLLSAIKLAPRIWETGW